MLECAILGDSIAVGVSLKTPACYRQAIGGISSQKYSTAYTKNISANHVLISLGSNDAANADTYANLKKIRARVTSPKVTWLLSSNNKKAREDAIRLAKEYKDDVLEITLISKDKVHPTPEGYKAISTEWKNRWTKK
jgi:lysophospholipase L1-like esterase